MGVITTRICTEQDPDARVPSLPACGPPSKTHPDAQSPRCVRACACLPACSPPRSTACLLCPQFVLHQPDRASRPDRVLAYILTLGARCPLRTRVPSPPPSTTTERPSADLACCSRRLLSVAFARRGPSGLPQARDRLRAPRADCPALPLHAGVPVRVPPRHRLQPRGDELLLPPRLQPHAADQGCGAGRADVGGGPASIRLLEPERRVFRALSCPQNSIS